MSSEAARRIRELRWARRENRELIDGRWVSTIAPLHGDQWIYGGYFCRCAPCTEANRVAMLKFRQRMLTERVEIDGVMVYRPGPHGSATTYNTYGCRCADCRLEYNAKRREMYAKKNAS